METLLPCHACSQSVLTSLTCRRRTVANELDIGQALEDGNVRRAVGQHNMNEVHANAAADQGSLQLSRSDQAYADATRNGRTCRPLAVAMRCSPFTSSSGFCQLPLPTLGTASCAPSCILWIWPVGHLATVDAACIGRRQCGSVD